MNKIIYNKYAEVLVRVGINLQSGQTVMIVSPPSAFELVREITEISYKMGASYVKTEFIDPVLDRIRILNQNSNNLAYFPAWLSSYMEQYSNDNVCIINIFSPNPKLFENIDDSLISIFNNGVLEGEKAYIKSRRNNNINSVAACFPSQEWASFVYPELNEEDALIALWGDVISINRLSFENPVDAWEKHKNKISVKRKVLDSLHIDKLIITGPGTDLEIGLIKNSIWTGGYYVDETSNLQIVPNIPTEEIFNVPDKYRVNGVVKTTLPLNYNGNIIDDVTFVFKEGKIVDYFAGIGYGILKNLIETDEGTKYLGEIALVSNESPIYKTKKIFYTTLYDENAVSHIAIGNSISSALPGSSKLSAEEKNKLGLNQSIKHVDFMIGSDEISVDAVLPNGSTLAILENGNWCL